jgi:ABC-type polysaccharide/polyol phosphate transport system ATPase subunit
MSDQDFATLNTSHQANHRLLDLKLQVQNLTKVFAFKTKQLLVLDNINIHLNPNEFVCLVGHQVVVNPLYLKSLPMIRL